MHLNKPLQLLIANSDQEYAGMINTITDSLSAAESKGASGQYVPYVDSFKNSLSFLSQNNSWLSKIILIKSNFFKMTKPHDQS